MPYSLFIVTYARGYHPVTGAVQPYHWSFFVLQDAGNVNKPGIAFQLRGMPGAFYYQGPESVELNKSQSKKEELEIGQVPENSIPIFDTLMKDVNIDISESSGWNCQNWTLDGLEKLRQQGWVEDVYSKDVVKGWLKET